MGFQHQYDSCYKCLIYFADGGKRTFYSLDWRNHEKDLVRDPDLGLFRLRTLIDEYGESAVTSVIYDNTTKQRIEQYYKGVRTF